jgi:hypothetical protein
MNQISARYLEFGSSDEKAGPWLVFTLTSDAQVSMLQSF